MDEDRWPGAATPRGGFRSHDPCAAVQIVHGNGATVFDAAGRSYIDLVSGYSANNFGHCHPRLVAAAIRAMGEIGHLTGLPHPRRARLEKRLAAIHGGEHVRTWLASTGSRAIEVAWKAAYVRRPGRLVTFDLGFHGRSIATGAISCTPRLPLGDFSAGPTIAFPRYGGGGVSQEEATEAAIESLERLPEDVSAILIEPAIGARGYYFAPDMFFQRIAAVAARRGITLISDEVQMGLGRMGGWFGCRTQRWEPDLMVLGKSLGGGLLPISAVVGRADLLDAIPAGVESETFAASPSACAVALEALDVIQEEGLLERAERVGGSFEAELSADPTLRRISVVFERRGAAMALDFASTAGGSAASRRFAEAAVQAGVLVHLSGAEGERVALIPPLTISAEEMASAVERLASAAECLPSG